MSAKNIYVVVKQLTYNPQNLFGTIPRTDPANSEKNDMIISVTHVGKSIFNIFSIIIELFTPCYYKTLILISNL